MFCLIRGKPCKTGGCNRRYINRDGKDGANGLLNMKKNGAYTIGQDEKAVVYRMPMASYEIGAVQKQVHIDNIPSEIMKILKK